MTKARLLSSMVCRSGKEVVLGHSRPYHGLMEREGGGRRGLGGREEGKERNLGKGAEAGIIECPNQKEPRGHLLRCPCLKVVIGQRPHSKSVKSGPQTALTLLHLLFLKLIRARASPHTRVPFLTPQTLKTKTENENKGDGPCKSRDPPTHGKESGQDAKEAGWAHGGTSHSILDSEHVAFAPLSLSVPQAPT